MKLDSQRLSAIYSSARSVVADEVSLVSVNRLHREGHGWAFSDEALSGTVLCAHLVLAQALTALQAELMPRPTRTPADGDRALSFHLAIPRPGWMRGAPWVR